MRIWVRMKSNPSIKKNISEESFDKNTMIRMSDDEINDQNKVGSINITQMLSSGKAPGLISSRGITGSKGSTDFNGKLDNGAMEDLLDRGLEAAKPRALERKKTKGKGFQKIKRVKVSKRKE